MLHVGLSQKWQCTIVIAAQYWKQYKGNDQSLQRSCLHCCVFISLICWLNYVLGQQ